MNVVKTLEDEDSHRQIRVKFLALILVKVVCYLVCGCTVHRTAAHWLLETSERMCVLRVSHIYFIYFHTFSHLAAPRPHHRLSTERRVYGFKVHETRQRNCVCD